MAAAGPFTVTVFPLKIVTVSPAIVFTLLPFRVVGTDKHSVYHECRRRGVDLGFSYSYACAPDTPMAARAAAEVLNLPLYSGLSDDEVARVIAAVRASLQSRRLVTSGT